jgi:hypothetical protein
MGNTLLAHVLYSCNQIAVDLNSFYSMTGNSHNISKFNVSNLHALHLENYPHHNNKCLISFRADNFHELLRLKLSYSKWHKETPDVNNYTKFFKNLPIADRRENWKDFYKNIKDELWPECKTYNDVQTLPKVIQDEIKELYTEPNNTINDNKTLLQFLTISYYDLYRVNNDSINAKCIYNISSYLNNDLKNIPELVKQYLGWDFNYNKSNVFHSYVIKNNKQYLDWFEKIMEIYNTLTTFTEVDVSNLAVWEKAIIIAKVHEQHNLHPSSIRWNDVNFKKIITPEEINYGQTI